MRYGGGPSAVRDHISNWGLSDSGVEVTAVLACAVLGKSAAPHTRGTGAAVGLQQKSTRSGRHHLATAQQNETPYPHTVHLTRPRARGG